jgi:amidase
MAIIRYLLTAALVLPYATQAIPNFSSDVTVLRARNNNGSKIPDLYSATLDEVAEGLKYGWYTSEDLTKAYLARISEVNGALHAVIETNPHALEEAKLADDARKAGRPIHSPFYGVPILIKDNIATARPE